MLTITSEVSNETFESLQKLAKENYRDLNQEIAYRLNQAIRYKKYLSDEYEGLFKVLSLASEAKYLNEDASLLANIKCAEKPLN